MNNQQEKLQIIHPYEAKQHELPERFIHPVLKVPNFEERLEINRGMKDRVKRYLA